LPRRQWLVLAALTGVGVAAVMLRASRQRENATAAGLVRALVEAAGPARLTEGRLSAGFAHGPSRPRSAGERRPQIPRTIKLMSAAAQIEALATQEPSSENLQALGLAHLALGDLAEAVTSLESALGYDPHDPQVLSDLAAVLLERGSGPGGLEEAVRALSLADEAVEIDPALAEPCFNRALALERLHLREAAIESWEDYARIDPHSPWTDDARKRSERLGLPTSSEAWNSARASLEAAAGNGDEAQLRGIIAGQQQATREWLLYEQLARWGDEILHGDVPMAASTLQAAANVARVHAALSTDPMAVEIVSALRPASGEGTTSPRLRTLASAHQALAEARQQLAEFHIDKARPLLESASADFLRGGSPAWFWASRALLVTDYYRGDHTSALRRLAMLRPKAESHGYHAVVGHLHWLEGLNDVVQARLSDALGHYQLGLAAFERGGETGNAAVLRSLISECLHSLGDRDEEWRERDAALAGLGEEMEERRSEGILMESGIAALEDGFPRAALYFQEPGLVSARKRGDPVQAADGLLSRGLIHTHLRKADEAIADLEEARTWTDRITDVNLRRRLDAELAYTRGLADALGDVDAAYTSLTGAINYFERRGADLRLPELYLARGRVALRRNDDVAANVDFRTGIAAFEAQRLAVVPPGQRISFFDTASELFDDAIELTVRHEGAVEALSLAERGRARQLLEGMPAGGTPLSATQIRDEIPAATALIFYSALPQRLICWVVTARGVDLVSTPLESRELARLVAALRAAIGDSASQDKARDDATRLHDLLIRPVAAQLTDSRTLVFVPDKALHSLPFAMLVNRETGHYLVETHEILVAPSATLFARASERERQMDTGSAPTLLAVGDPSFDATVYPYLPRLDVALEEATRISALYTDALVLSRANATEAAFLGAIEGRSIVHFAGHAVANDSDPLHSRLVLAPDPYHGGDGTLFAEELYGKRFDHTRLVVLAACSTAGGRVSRGEGALSLARPFLVGGVPAVIASLWDIEDRGSVELATRLHHHLAAGAAPQMALRAAQLELLTQADPVLRSPSVWAAFELIGGSRNAPPEQRRLAQ
jgi:CHAT domain-containing protein